MDQSQKTLSDSACIHTCTEPGVYVPGIGYIGQYNGYANVVWETGITYFMRDYLVREIEEKERAQRCTRQLRAELATLNSELIVYEKRIGLAEWTARHQ